MPSPPRRLPVNPTSRRPSNVRTSIAILFALVLVGLIALGAAGHSFQHVSSSTPDGAVQNFFQLVKDKDYDAAYAMVSPASGVEKWAFIRDVAGNNGSLKTVSELQKAETKVLNNSGDRAQVRTRLQWATAVGAMNEDRDLELVKDSGQWRVMWPKPFEADTT